MNHCSDRTPIAELLPLKANETTNAKAHGGHQRGQRDEGGKQVAYDFEMELERKQPDQHADHSDDLIKMLLLTIFLSVDRNIIEQSLRHLIMPFDSAIPQRPFCAGRRRADHEAERPPDSCHRRPSGRYSQRPHLRFRLPQNILALSAGRAGPP